jgi:hypothetical protein
MIRILQCGLRDARYELPAVRDHTAQFMPRHPKFATRDPHCGMRIS